MPDNFKKRFKKMLDYKMLESSVEEKEELFDDYDDYTDLMGEFEGK